MRRQLRFKTGDVFSRSELRDTVRGISDLYSTIGHASAEVIPRTDQQPATLTMDVTIEVTEGPEVYVERINISGNTRSEDRILRREIPFVEGDLFTLQKLQRARQRLINLGYFESVNVETQPGTDKTRIIVNVEVTERPDRRLLHRRWLLVGGQLRRYPRHLPEQLPGPGLAGGPADPGRRQEPAGDHQLHRALAVRPAARRPASICSASSATTTTTTTSRSGGDVRLSHPFQEYWRSVGHLPAHPGRHQQHPDRRRFAAPGRRQGTTITSAITLGSHPRQPRQHPDSDPGWPHAR